jgi:hypothetical protein
LEKSHEAQAHAGGFEAVAHLLGEQVVSCEHGRYPFMDASNVSSTLHSSECGCLVHEINRKSSGARKAMHPAASPFVIGEYARKTIMKQCQLLRRQTELSAFFILPGLPMKWAIEDS